VVGMEASKRLSMSMVFLSRESPLPSEAWIGHCYGTLHERVHLVRVPRRANRDSRQSLAEPHVLSGGCEVNSMSDRRNRSQSDLHDRRVCYLGRLDDRHLIFPMRPQRGYLVKQGDMCQEGRHLAARVR